MSENATALTGFEKYIGALFVMIFAAILGVIYNKTEKIDDAREAAHTSILKEVADTKASLTQSLSEVKERQAEFTAHIKTRLDDLDDKR